MMKFEIKKKAGNLQRPSNKKPALVMIAHYSPKVENIFRPPNKSVFASTWPPPENDLCSLFQPDSFTKLGYCPLNSSRVVN
ncbi:hypothetical protein ACO2Q8_28710 [Larkinella sp. VNQ87]|uniref:hypothetical protein n=1 Tax=Larkinella sp. VNQ87 TaxID=3400921 RepID=UPI003C11E170